VTGANMEPPAVIIQETLLKDGLVTTTAREGLSAPRRALAAKTT